MIHCISFNSIFFFTLFSPRLPKNLRTAHFTNWTITSLSSELSRTIEIVSNKFALSKKEKPVEVVAICIQFFFLLICLSKSIIKKALAIPHLTSQSHLSSLTNHLIEVL